MVGRCDGRVRITGCGMDEREVVMRQREVRAQVDGPLQFDDRFSVAAAQPERAAHGPVRGGVAVVDHEALRSSHSWLGVTGSGASAR